MEPRKKEIMKDIMPFFQIALLIMIMTPSIEAVAASADRKVSGILYTQDKEAIAYEHCKKGFNSVVIVCPGFYNSKKNRWMVKTVDLILPEHDVIIFDFRGHGDSSGKFSWSAKEDMDVDTVVDYVVAQGYKSIGILAFSLGAAASVNAAAQREDIDSMVLISCPSKFSAIDFYFWEPGMFSDLADNIACNWEGKGTRATNIFTAQLPKPIETITKIKHTAILFIHGDRDWVIKDRHSRKLYAAAQTYKRLEIIENGLHAERLIQLHPDRMKRLILDWFSETLKTKL